MIWRKSDKYSLKFEKMIGKKISYLRLSSGLSLNELGKLIGVSGIQMSKYENAVDHISAGRLFFVLKILGVDVSDFIDDVSRLWGVELENHNKKLFQSFIRGIIKLDEDDLPIVSNFANNFNSE